VSVSDKFEWDDDKERQNLAAHGLAFDVVERFFGAVERVEEIDQRFQYDEERLIAFARVDVVVLCCVYTWRGGRRRIISLRRAVRGEVKRFEINLRGRPKD
jgi:uncharacterized DUF497 family protein